MFLFIISVIEFCVGAGLHFLYDLITHPLIAMIAPINESIFEHVKLVFYSMFFVGIIVMLFSKKQKLYTPTSLLIGIITAMLLMFMIYYFYRYGFGIESMYYDIFLLFVVQFIGNITSSLIIKHSFELKNKVIVILFIIIIILILLCTFLPPTMPMFIEGNPIY